MTREERKIEQLTGKIAGLGPMLPGSISEQWDAGVPVQGSRQACEAWAVLPAQLHGGREKLDDVRQEQGSTRGAATP